MPKRKIEKTPSREFGKVIGLTGGIATGKSTVSAILRQSGLPVICADEIAHAVTRKGAPTFKKILKAFGKITLDSSGELDRAKIAAVVFHDPKKLKVLESIVHPEVRKEALRQVRQERVKKTPLLILDVPLLFESGFDQLCDATVCVTTSKKVQLARLCGLRGMTKRDALARVKAQMPLKEKARRADFVISNNGTKTELKKRVLTFLKKLRHD